MIVQRFIMALFALVATASFAFAQGTQPQPSGGDRRMRTVVYAPDAVVAIRGHLGYQMLIEFDPDERIENVSIGDSVSWQVTPNRKATLLFVKPVERNAATNMTVVTNLRRYAFELTAREASGPSDPNIIYGVRFIYPRPPAPPPAPPPPPPVDPADAANLNFSYRFTGADRMRPERVFDNGHTTYFQFPAQGETPAIFVIGPDDKEELVNQQVRGRYTVVDVVAARFALRYGRSRTVVHNQALAGAGRN